MSHINDRLFQPDVIQGLKKEFNKHSYRRIVIDDFLKPEIAEQLYANFPTADQMRRSYKGLNEEKSEGSSFDQYHPLFEGVKKSLTDPAFTKVLDEMAGFEGLAIPDDFKGAGVHQGFDGSFLDIHVDFNMHPVFDIYRRLNLLIYLNKDWKEEYGGHLELWNEDVSECLEKISPDFNRCAIFATTETSWHGYGKMDLPEGVSRRSIFSYYYTPVADRSKEKYHDTFFKPRPTDTRMKKTKTIIKENTKNFIKKSLRKMGAKKFIKRFE